MKTALWPLTKTPRKYAGHSGSLRRRFNSLRETVQATSQQARKLFEAKNTKARSSNFGRMRSANFDARRLERPANTFGESERVRTVTVKTNRLRIDRHPFAADRLDAAFLRHRQRSGKHGFLVIEQRAGVLARHKRPVRPISAVCENFLDSHHVRLAR